MLGRWRCSRTRFSGSRRQRAVVESAWTAVGGSTASGTDQFKPKHPNGQTSDVHLTVTDTAGNGAAETRPGTE